jgi:hypothetical protein
MRTDHHRCCGDIVDLEPMLLHHAVYIVGIADVVAKAATADPEPAVIGRLGRSRSLLRAAAASNLSLWMRKVLFALVSAIQNWARECRTFYSPLPA